MTKFSRIARNWTPLVSGMIVLASLCALGWIWLEVQQFETLRQEEHKEFARQLVQTSRAFIKKGEYVYFSDMLELLSKMNFIEYIAMYRENNDILPVGSKENISADIIDNLGKGIPSLYQDRKTKLLYMRYGLDYDEAPTDLRIVFSLREYDKPRTGIKVATGVIVLLVLLVTLIGVRLDVNRRRLERANLNLREMHKKLQQAEQTKSDMIKAIGHDATHYVNLVKEMLDTDLPSDKYSNYMDMLDQLKNVIGTQQQMEEASTQNALAKLRNVVGALEIGNRAFPISNYDIMKSILTSLNTLLENLKFNEEINQGRMNCDPQKVNIVRFVQKIAKRMDVYLITKGIKIIVAEVTPSPEVWVDEDQLERVIFNLLHNAYKYTREKTTITVSFAKKDGQVTTYVADQGPGIPKDAWEPMFEQFVRLNDATYLRPEDKKGSGLGLAISRKFIELNRGRLGIERSTIGQGTTFYFTLPQAGQSQEKGAEHAQTVGY